MKIIFKIAVLFLYLYNCAASFATEGIKVYTVQEITLAAQGQYINPYKDVDCWIELKGPDFQKKIYGFWNGANDFVFRVVATQPGHWSWTSYSNQQDNGLNGKSGEFIATA